MIKLLILILVTAGLMAAAPLIAENRGFVYIDTGGYVVQLSLVSACIILVLFLAALYLLYALLVRFFRVKSGLQTWYGDSRVKSSRKVLAEAAASYIEGDYEKAYRLSEKSRKWSEVPVMNGLIGLSARMKGNKPGDGARLLAEIEREFKGHPAAVSILRTRMYLESREYEKALAEITALRKKRRPTREISALYYRCLEALSMPETIAENRKEFLSSGVMDGAGYNRYVSGRIIGRVNAAKDPGDLDRLYRGLPGDIAGNADVANAFACAYGRMGNGKKAAKIVLKTLRSLPDPSGMYANIARWDSGNEDVRSYLERVAERGGSMDAAPADLLAALANLYMNGDDNERAAKIYEHLADRAPCPEFYSRLGQCYKRLGVFQKSELCYRMAEQSGQAAGS